MIFTIFHWVEGASDDVQITGEDGILKCEIGNDKILTIYHNQLWIILMNHYTNISVWTPRELDWEWEEIFSWSIYPPIFPRIIWSSAIYVSVHILSLYCSGFNQCLLQKVCWCQLLALHLWRGKVREGLCIWLFWRVWGGRHEHPKTIW